LSVERAVALFSEWLTLLARWDEVHSAPAERISKIGNTHVYVGVKPRLMIMTMVNFMLSAYHILTEKEFPPEVVSALLRMMGLSLVLMMEEYEEERLRNFRRMTGMSDELFERMMSLPWQ